MNTLNTTRVQLPDGTLVKIEGGGAEDTAHFLANRYLKGSLVTTEARPIQPRLTSNFITTTPRVIANSVEESLELPVLNFGEPAKATASALTSEEEPLELPVLNFDKPGKTVMRPASSEEEPLELPKY